MRSEDLVVAVIGLGYVGLPLAVEFGKTRPVVGFDIDEGRINELQEGIDRTKETSSEEIQTAKFLKVTSDKNHLREANCYIVTVPTPIDEFKNPDLGPLKSATKLVGEMLCEGDLVIYESTVFPGCTEEVCVPILEQKSGLKYREGFHCGYSPERINPGDATHRLPDIVKITSGSSPQVADTVDDLYQTIITAGTYRAESIQIAEAAKVIENTQRDLNIALVNELAIIFNRLGLDTQAVLRAAGTKWNFLPFQPGLVGGHCIGVDPYYLTHKAQKVGYRPEVILAGRRINDGMSSYVVSRLLQGMTDADIKIQGSHVLILGLAFKENTPDFRNSRVVDIIKQLHENGCAVDVFDPVVDQAKASRQLGISLLQSVDASPQPYDAVLVAVGHNVFREIPLATLDMIRRPNSLIYDLKNMLPVNAANMRL